MIIFKPYSSIKDFLQRFTILKIGKLHIRLHRIVDSDKTTLYHNHPFHYISIILKGGYTESVVNPKGETTYTHKPGAFIFRKNTTYHRITSLRSETITFFIAWGNYGWQALNTVEDHSNDGLYQREIKGRTLWCKKENGTWFVGHKNPHIASKETRHSIHQCIESV